jgi:hypothetical protein
MWQSEDRLLKVYVIAVTFQFTFSYLKEWYSTLGPPSTEENKQVSNCVGVTAAGMLTISSLHFLLDASEAK